MSELEQARQAYAEELRYAAHIRAPEVARAFATVPRERFLGPGPWRIFMTEFSLMRGYWTTPDADPRHLYHNVLVAIDEARGLNNGSPGLWAFLFDRLGVAPGSRVLHLGCGTGYYSAILAELVGPSGKVTAVELDADLAARAKTALEPWRQAEAIAADGTSFAPGEVDLIVASAGATHPPALWLDRLRPGGRLLFPLTSDSHGGGMLKLTRREGDHFAAAFLCRVWFYGFAGARESEANRRLEAVMAKGDLLGAHSLRRDAHEESERCWLHGEGWCLSRDPLPETGAP
jgi:protein-L-isoaspartate(D-aspartate) O-methyltransferase